MSKNKAVKIVLIGSTGEGKSSFGNYILRNDSFKESDEPDSCTETINCSKGKENTEVENLFIIDTPGISDSKGRDDIFIKKIIKELKINYTNDINSFLIFFNINKIRLSFEMKKQIYYFCSMFPIKDFWQHVGIVFTFSYESYPDEKLEKMIMDKKNYFISDFLETIKGYINEINKLNNFEIGYPKNLNVFFTDCGEVYPPYTHIRTDKEIHKIIDWASNLSKLDLSFVNDNIYINYKFYKQIKDYIIEKKIFINSNKYKIIKQYKKQYKTIDFNDKEEIKIDTSIYKEDTKYYKLSKEKSIISINKEIYDDKYFRVKNKYKYFERWDEVDRYDNIIKYGNEENIVFTYDSDIISRNWRIFNVSYKTEINEKYDYDIEYEKKWILFIPVTYKYKHPFKVIQKIHYKKEDKIDDLGYKKYGDWVIHEYGNTRREYSERYLI